MTQDEAEAVKWYRKAADQGFVEAQNRLGYMYLEGQGVTQDDVEAARWFRKAADQGLVGAQSKLGGMYGIGRGVLQNEAEAVKWYRKAATQGDAKAQFVLGLMYEGGYGVTQDYVTAHMWFNLATAQGHEKARTERNRVANRMTSTQIAEAQRLARSWRKASHTPKTTPQPQPRTKRSQTHQIQELLTIIGYDSGPVDGIRGKKTRAAIQQFQRDKGLPASGEPDDATLKAMNLK